MHSSLRETAVPSLRDRRLKSDQESLMGYRNPNVDIVSIAGNPPDSYKITYRCRGVRDREFQISDQHTVRLEFPGDYPAGAPKFFAETPVSKGGGGVFLQGTPLICEDSEVPPLLLQD